MSFTLSTSAVFNQAGDKVFCALLLRDSVTNAFQPKQIDSGIARLMHQFNSKGTVAPGSDLIEVARVDLNGAHANNDGSIMFNFGHPPKRSNLKVHVDLTLLDTSALNSKVDVLEDVDELEHLRPAVDDHFIEEQEGTDNIVDLSEDIAPILAQIDFTELSPLLAGTGPIAYTGGGNRLVFNDDAKLVLQNEDVLPTSLKASTFIEALGANCLNNSSFTIGSDGAVPTGYEVATALLCTKSFAKETISDLAKVLELRFRNPNPANPFNDAKFRAGTHTIDVSKAWTFSILMAFRRNTSDSNFYNLDLKVEFYDGGGALLGDKTLALVHDEFDDKDLNLAQITVLPADFPPLTSQIMPIIFMDGIDHADDLTLSVALPQVEQSTQATSRILDFATRNEDRLSIPQTDNLELGQGSFVVKFFPGHDGAPLLTPIRFFDSRDAGGLNGFTAYQRTDGKVVFEINDGATTQAIESTAAINLVAGQETEIIAIWSESAQKREIVVDGQIVVSDVSAFSIPATLNADLHIGSNASGTEFLNGQILDFRVQRTTDFSGAI